VYAYMCMCKYGTANGKEFRLFCYVSLLLGVASFVSVFVGV